MFNQEQQVIVSNDINNQTLNQNANSPFPDIQTETEVSKLFKRCASKHNNPLETNIPYIGVIREIVFKNEMYPRIVIYIDININGILKSTTVDFTFGGDYDEFNMDKLTAFLANIRNYQLNWVNAQTYETITQSMHFLIGTEVKVIQRMSKNNRTYNDISVIGEFNVELGKVVNNTTIKGAE